MSGVIFLAIFGAWLLASVAIAMAVTSRIKKIGLRVVAALSLFGVLLVLPVFDEIVGRWQFKKMCRENSEIEVHKDRFNGGGVYLADLPSIKIKGSLIPITSRPWRFLDATTKEVVVSFNTLSAHSGILIRALGTSETNVPLIFSEKCENSVNPVRLLKDNEITQIQRSALGKKD